MMKFKYGLFIFLLLSGCLVDYDADGSYRITCTGDSNTGINPARVGVVGWCEQAQTLASSGSVQVHGVKVTEPIIWSNVGAVATTACAGGFIPDGPTQVQMALDANADLVIIAHGTNDIWNQDAATAFGCLQALVNMVTAAQRQFVVATIPPVYAPAPDRNEVIDEVNGMVVAAWGSKVVDFHDGMTIDLFESDGIHLNNAGQTLRAQRAAMELPRL